MKRRKAREWWASDGKLWVLEGGVYRTVDTGTPWIRVREVLPKKRSGKK